MSFSNTEHLTVKKVSEWDIIKKQVRLKFNIYQGSIVMIILAQIFGLCLSIGSSSYTFFSGGSEGNYFLEFSQIDYDGQPIIVFTILGLVGLSFSLGLRHIKDMSASFISNGKTNTISNVIFLSLISLCSGVIAYVLTICLKVIVLYVQGIESFYIVELPAINELLVASAGTVLYALLFSMISYFIGELYDSNKFLFAIFIGFTFVIAMVYGVAGVDTIREWIHSFLSKEHYIHLFAIKVLAIIAILFSSILLIARKVEVRK